MTGTSERPDPGVGETPGVRKMPGAGTAPELSLRVSVASLARVVFLHPEDGEAMLALEHKATLLPDAGRVTVKAQPFGGAVRIVRPEALQALIGAFHFDGERSRSEQDLRIFIRPSDWPAVRDFCLREFNRDEDEALESDPARELVEEFKDALGVDLRREQYRVRPAKIVLENEPARSENVHAAARLTVRLYRVFAAEIVDEALCRALVANDRHTSVEGLRGRALDDAADGGRGRANAVLVAPLQQVRAAYLRLAPERRGEPLPFGGTTLSGNVPAVLEDVAVPKYGTVKLLGGGPTFCVR